MQNVTSNLVYVVALNAEPLTDDGYSFVDIVLQDGRYFHPLTGTWPKTPPNYLGFRFSGELQQIRHVDSYELTDDVAEALPRLRGHIDEWDPIPRYIYRLGSPIKPLHQIKTDGLYGPGHHWAALDLLLTSQTLREARDRTQKRLAEAGEEG